MPSKFRDFWLIYFFFCTFSQIFISAEENFRTPFKLQISYFFFTIVTKFLIEVFNIFNHDIISYSSHIVNSIIAIFCPPCSSLLTECCTLVYWAHSFIDMFSFVHLKKINLTRFNFFNFLYFTKLVQFC